MTRMTLFTLHSSLFTLHFSPYSINLFVIYFAVSAECRNFVVETNKFIPNMTTITFNVPNREFGFFKRLTTAQTIRNFMSIMAMLLLALTGGLTLTSCGQEDDPIH